MWVPVSDAGQIERAFKAVRALLITGAEKFPKQWIGSPGGRERIDTYLHRTSGYWAAMPAQRRTSAYFRCLIGSTDPKQRPGLDIDVEINLPRTGVNRRYAGAFVKDERGRIYLAHSGKIGGGHEGIGRSAFRDFYRGGNWQRVTWPDRQTSEMIVLAPVRDARLAEAVAHFASAVASFKRTVRSGPEADFSQSGAMPPFEAPFSAESGPTDPEAGCWQAIVVAALADALRNRALDLGIEIRRGLVAMRSGTETWLFEVVADDLAASVGALVMNAENTERGTKRIVIVADGMVPDRVAVLHRLGIAVVTYRWDGAKPVFDGLTRAIQARAI